MFDIQIFCDMIEVRWTRGRSEDLKCLNKREDWVMDFEAIKKAAAGYEADMTKFLRELIAIPSESCEEEGVIKRTILEMERLGFDRAEIDPEGNALG